jgi:hypothetical protein
MQGHLAATTTSLVVLPTDNMTWTVDRPHPSLEPLSVTFSLPNFSSKMMFFACRFEVQLTPTFQPFPAHLSLVREFFQMPPLNMLHLAATRCSSSAAASNADCRIKVHGHHPSKSFASYACLAHACSRHADAASTPGARRRSTCARCCSIASSECS